MINLSLATRNGMLDAAGLKTQFHLGFLYLYAGPVPANADVPLDTTTMHTQIVKIADANASGAGLQFEVHNGEMLQSDATLWQAAASFDGFESGELELDATFFRLCAAADDGRAAADPGVFDPYRIQGTVGTALSAADLKLGVVTYAPAATVTISNFRLRLFARG